MVPFLIKFRILHGKRISCKKFHVRTQQKLSRSYVLKEGLIRSGHMRLGRSFYLCYSYIDDLIVFNNKRFIGFIIEIYPPELNVKWANRSDDQANYLDLTFILGNNNRLYRFYCTYCDDFGCHRKLIVDRLLSQVYKRQSTERFFPKILCHVCRSDRKVSEFS